LYGLETRSVCHQRVAVYPMRYRVADKHIAEIFFWKLIRVVAGDARDRCRPVQVIHDRRAETQPVVRLAETWIPCAAQQQVFWLRVTVGRKQIAKRIESQTEWIDLSVGEALNVRPIGPKTVNVTTLELDFVTVSALYLAAVNIAVASIDPTIHAVRKCIV